MNDLDVTIDRYEVTADGVTHLDVRVDGPLPDDPEAMFAHLGGTITPTGQDVRLGWRWEQGMCPPDTRRLVRQHLLQAVETWAAGWIAASGTWSSAPVELADPGVAL